MESGSSKLAVHGGTLRERSYIKPSGISSLATRRPETGGFPDTLCQTSISAALYLFKRTDSHTQIIIRKRVRNGSYRICAGQYK